LADDEGPGTLKFLTASLRRQFAFGTLQAVFSKADARDESTGIVTPEAPRTIFDALAALDRLPFALHARGEYEYVGHKLLDVGGFEAIPVGETRMAMVRPFLNGRLELGVNGMLARGYTGQTTETFDPAWRMGGVPYCAPGSGPSGAQSDFDCGTNEQSVGIRMVSWVGDQSPGGLAQKSKAPPCDGHSLIFGQRINAAQKQRPSTRSRWVTPRS